MLDGLCDSAWPWVKDKSALKRLVYYTGPGEHTKSELENGPVEIVNLSIKHGDFPELC